MGTKCAPLVADLFLFCYVRDFMMYLSKDKKAGVIDAFNTTSRYLDDILNINYVYFDIMVNQIYPSELQRNKAIKVTSDTEVAFLDLVRKYACSSFSSLVQSFFLPRDTLLRTYLDSLQLVTGTVLLR